MKKLPPYGRPLADLIEKGKKPENDIFLFIGKNAWDKARDYENSSFYPLALPFSYYPDQYWWPVKNCNVLIVDTDYSVNENDKNRQLHFDKISISLFKSGAALVRALYYDCAYGHQFINYKKDF